MFDISHKKDVLKNILSKDFVFEPDRKDFPVGIIYGEYPIIHIIEDDSADEALRILEYTADWFRHPHPLGRDIRGESDFAAIRLVCALFEDACYGKLPQRIKLKLKSFFTENDFSSIYGSENHALMYTAARLLAAQFYKDEYFRNFDISAKDCYEKDLKFINEFLDFRAGCGWGEFDSLGYSFEIMLILATLHKYTDNAALKSKCHMAMDIILLDMMADSYDGMYGGAHGRSYPQHIIGRSSAPMVQLYHYYFGGIDHKGDDFSNVNIYLSDYVPSDIVYRIAHGRRYPFENRERKHLHCCSAWCNGIDHKELGLVKGSINKYTYVCEDYILGAVNHQDDYPEESSDGWYAHHQQHEWELTFPGNGEHKIFSHHSAIADFHKINNRWTGDCGCCCGSFYTNQNTAIAMYNIENKEKQPLINAYVPLEAFGEKITEEKYLFLEYGKLYISLYFDNGYRINNDDEFANKELLSDGWQNVVVCRVEYKDTYGSLLNFASSIKSKPVVFDREAKTVTFDGIRLCRDGNSENGTENVYPYKKVYDCPFMSSIWDSKVITVTSEDKTVVYDFIKNTMKTL